MKNYMNKHTGCIIVYKTEIKHLNSSLSHLCKPTKVNMGTINFHRREALHICGEFNHCPQYSAYELLYNYAYYWAICLSSRAQYSPYMHQNAK